jgi:hypothetical protein
VVGLYLLGDLAIRCFGLRRDHLGDQVALLLGGEVTAMNVLGNDIGSHPVIIALFMGCNLAANRVGIDRLAEILFLVSARLDSEPL